MLDKLWAGMILLGIVWAAIHGNLEAVTNEILNSAKEAVMLCITMLGAVSFWTGIMKVGQEAGLVGVMTKGIKPLLRWLFPNLPEGSEAQEYIAVNCVSNFLGLGWAATPAGLKAMEALAKLQEQRGDWKSGERWAGNEMCTFLVINISSLQLIPVNIIAYRAQYGSVQPAAIVGAAIVATLVSTVTAVIFCKVRSQ
ncbi:MAG: nucleoside recognition protein [Lachnospiraceae bacterium]